MSQRRLLVQVLRCIVFVTTTFTTVLQQFVNVRNLPCHLLMVVVGLSVLEYKPGVKKFLVNVLRSQITTAHYEYFCRDETGSLGLGSLNLLKEFLKDPHQRLKICRPEYFCDKEASFLEEIASKLHGMEDQLTLCIGIFAPVGTDVRGTVIENDFTLLIFEHFLECLITGQSGNIADKGLGAWHFLYWVKIHPNNCRICRHELFGHLHPPSWGGTQINHSCRIVEETILSIQLY